MNAALHQLLQTCALSYLNKQKHDLIFDADSTLIETTGRQEASAYIPHYSSVGYHPLVINEYHSKLLVASLLRCGNSYSANGIIEQLRTVFSGLQISSSRTIFFRGDSVFYDSELMNTRIGCRTGFRADSSSVLRWPGPLSSNRMSC